jgi:hypothetical protein
LVKHCGAAERIWFQRTLAGIPVNECDGHAVGGEIARHAGHADILAEQLRARHGVASTSG